MGVERHPGVFPGARYPLGGDWLQEIRATNSASLFVATSTTRGEGERFLSLHISLLPEEQD